jgi:hypothetical protein
MTNWTKLYCEGVDLDEEFESFEPITGSRLDNDDEEQYIRYRDQDQRKEQTDDQAN